MRLRQIWPLVLPALLAAAACGDARGRTAEATTTADTAIAVVDDAGHTVRLAEPAERVVSLVPAATDLILALGAADRLVARTDYDTDPRLADLPSVGGGLTPNLEALVALRPDLVIAWADGRTRSVVQRLRGLGIPVYAARGNSLAFATRTAARVGELIGREAAAYSLIAALEAQLDSVRRAVAGRERPSVFYVLWGEPPRTAGGGTFVDQLIRIAGGRNIFADLNGWPQVGLESVLARDPDVLLLPRGGGGQPDPERLRHAPGWRRLEAVREGHVLRMDVELLNRPGPHIGLAARRLAELLHPEAFPPDTPEATP